MMRTDRNYCGFTIAESLIVLAISAMLLTALAVAFNASIDNYRANEDIFRAVNSARQALYRMTTQLRTGYAVEPTEPSNRCSFYTSAGQDISYEYRTADKKLYLITNSNGHEYVLCDNVTAANFAKTLTIAGNDCKSVQISITVTVRPGNVTRKLVAAAVIRRNLDT
jgi:type II secretory pathway pseudopilin PulG